MRIELFLVPPGNRGFGKSLIEKAIADVQGPDFSNILYLAPTRQLVRSWQRDFHPYGGGCYIPPRATTHWELSRSLYLRHGGRLLLRKNLVPLAIAGLTGHGIGYSRLVSDFIMEMKNHLPEETVDLLRRRFEEIFDELDIPEEVSDRAFEAINIFSKYQESLATAGIADEEDSIMLAASFAKRQSGPEVLILDGFYELTPAEALFINSLIGKARKTLISIPISDVSDDLTHCYSQIIGKEFGVEPVFLNSSSNKPNLDYICSKSREEELEGIARHIKSLFVSGRLRELDNVFVTFPKLSEYQAMIERVFTRYGIPYSPAPETTRHFDDLFSLLEAVADGFPRMATAQFLASPYFKGISEVVREAAPQIALEAGSVTGRDSWQRLLEAHGCKTEGTEIFKKVSSINVLSNLNSYHSFINVLVDVLKKLRFTPDDEDADGYEEVLKGLCVLDSIPGLRTRGLREMTEAMKFYLNTSDARREEVQGVRIAPLRELRGLEPDYLYVGGLKDGDLPARPEIDFILPDRVRSRLGLVDMNRNLRLQGYIFARLVSTAKHLRLSYPSMEGEKLFLPSLFLRVGREVKERIFGDFSQEEALTRRIGEPLSKRISEITGIKKYQATSLINVTDIDAYRACPRKFFIEKILDLEPPDIKEYELEPKIIGSIAHEVMEKLVGPAPDDMDAFTRRAESVLSEVMERWPLDPYFKEVIRESFLTLLPGIYEIEQGLISEGYKVEMAEYRVHSEPLPGIKLKGKIDRVDMKDGGLALVLDYKTGAADLSSTRTLSLGATLQPFIYAAMLKSEGLTPESVGIYSLKDARISRVPRNKDLKEGRTLEHFMESALIYLDSTVSDMRDGDFGARPLSEGTCRYCHERPYCPYIQGDPS